MALSEARLGQKRARKNARRAMRRRNMHQYKRDNNKHLRRDGMGFFSRNSEQADEASKVGH